jgi:hypothetical protein
VPVKSSKVHQSQLTTSPGETRLEELAPGPCDWWAFSSSTNSFHHPSPSLPYLVQNAITPHPAPGRL